MGSRWEKAKQKARGLLCPGRKGREKPVIHTEPKVFGIGLSKTGTTSLAKALRILGYNAKSWAWDGTIIDWPEFYRLEAATDTPCAAQFESLYHTFEDSKFIHTTRDAESWNRSVEHHFGAQYGIEAPSEFEEMWKDEDFWGWGRKNCIRFMKIHQNLYSGHESWKSAHEEFRKRVEEFFREERQKRYLKIDITESERWDKICDFLEEDIPNVEFPHLNKTKY